MDRWILLVVFIGISCQCTLIIPSFIRICYRDDPHLNDCIAQSVEALKPFLRAGIPEFQIPPCEPLEVALVKFDRMAGLDFISSTYTKINIQGGTNFEMKSINADIEKNNIELKLFIPRLSMTANYNMDGKVLMLPIKGEGKTNGNFSDLNIDTKINGVRYKNLETNQTHFHVANFSVIVDIGHAQIHVDNLFNGNKKLANGMNQFLNENYKTISAELKPTLEIKLSDSLKKFANQIFNKYPLDLLLPLSKV